MVLEPFIKQKSEIRKARCLRDYSRLAFLTCMFFTFHDAQAQPKWDGKSPYWLAGACGRLEFSAWDKFNVHPPYHIKYIVKHSRFTYIAEKISGLNGEVSHAIFPDDFVDSTGGAAIVSLPCISDKISYEIYGNETRIESGDISVSYKINVTN